MHYIALITRISMTHYKVNSFGGLSQSSLCSFSWQMHWNIVCYCVFSQVLPWIGPPMIPRPPGMFCFELFLLKSLCWGSASFWSVQFGGNFHSSLLMLPPDRLDGGEKDEGVRAISMLMMPTVKRRMAPCGLLENLIPVGFSSFSLIK